MLTIGYHLNGLEIFQKISRKICRFKNKSYLCNPINKTGRFV